MRIFDDPQRMEMGGSAVLQLDTSKNLLARSSGS
jgi:hypothetical protein